MTDDFEIAVEYSGEIIGKYGLDFDGKNFLLTTKLTDCLAKNQCGIAQKKPKVNLSQLQEQTPNSCATGSGCC